MAMKLKALNINGVEITFSPAELLHKIEDDKTFIVKGNECYMDSIERVEDSKETDNIGKKTVFSSPERKRIYHFPEGDMTIENVCELIVRPSGTHRLKTLDGKYYIIPKGWLGIELDIDKWDV